MPEEDWMEQPAPPAGAALPLERRFDVLRNARRRYVLEYLREQRGAVDIGDLSEYVAARETGLDRTALSREQRKRAYVALYQCHLPRMDEAAVVRLDTARGVVAPGRTAPGLYRYLTPREPRADRWYRYYLGIVAGGPLLWAASLLPGGPAGIGTQAVVGTLVATLLACSLAHVLVRSGAAPFAAPDLHPLPRWPDV